MREHSLTSRRSTVQSEGAVRADPSDEQPAEPNEPLPAYSPDPGFRGAAFMTTFYPNAQTVEDASLVRTEAGSETQVSITLPLTTAVSVKGVISVPGEVGGGRIILSKKIHKTYMSFLEEWVRKDGGFSIQQCTSRLIRDSCSIPGKLRPIELEHPPGVGSRNI